MTVSHPPNGYPSYETSDLRNFGVVVGPMYCRSDTHFIKKKLVYQTHSISGCTAFLSWFHSSVGRMHNICRSDAQYYRPDAQLW